MHTFDSFAQVSFTVTPVTYRFMTDSLLVLWFDSDHNILHISWSQLFRNCKGSWERTSLYCQRPHAWGTICWETFSFHSWSIVSVEVSLGLLFFIYFLDEFLCGFIWGNMPLSPWGYLTPRAFSLSIMGGAVCFTFPWYSIHNPVSTFGAVCRQNCLPMGMCQESCKWGLFLIFVSLKAKYEILSL